MSTTVHTDSAPKAIGPYSQAVVTESLVFTSGQIPLNPLSGEMEEGGIKEQTHRVCQNISAVLEAAGSSLDRVLKTVCYLCDMEDFTAFNDVYEKYFVNKPARSCVAVKKLPKGSLVEIDVIAERKC